jgi:protein-S-isoprenylcysteine O-methyltransferase Ste14
MLWLRALLFALVVPGTFAGWLPAYLAAADDGPRFVTGPARWLGAPLVLLGWIALGWCFVDFVRRGRGTPNPLDPPRELVVAGLYRYTRNPMYVGALIAIAGVALLSGSRVLLFYSAAFWLFTHLFVLLYEEPALRRTFGASYDRYHASVPRWLGRRRRAG